MRRVTLSATGMPAASIPSIAQRHAWNSSRHRGADLAETDRVVPDLVQEDRAGDRALGVGRFDPPFDAAASRDLPRQPARAAPPSPHPKPVRFDHPLREHLVAGRHRRQGSDRLGHARRGRGPEPERRERARLDGLGLPTVAQSAVGRACAATSASFASTAASPTRPARSAEAARRAASRAGAWCEATPRSAASVLGALRR